MMDKNFNIDDFMNMSEADAMKAFSEIYNKAAAEKKAAAINKERAADTKKLMSDIVNYIYKYFPDYFDAKELAEITKGIHDITDEEIAEMFETIAAYCKLMKNFNFDIKVNDNGKKYEFNNNKYNNVKSSVKNVSDVCLKNNDTGNVVKTNSTPTNFDSRSVLDDFFKMFD